MSVSFSSLLDTEIELTEDDDLKKSETNSNVDPNATTTESYSIAGKISNTYSKNSKTPIKIYN